MYVLVQCNIRPCPSEVSSSLVLAGALGPDRRCFVLLKHFETRSYFDIQSGQLIQDLSPQGHCVLHNKERNI